MLVYCSDRILQMKYVKIRTEWQDTYHGDGKFLDRGNNYESQVVFSHSFCIAFDVSADSVKSSHNSYGF